MRRFFSSRPAKIVGVSVTAVTVTSVAAIGSFGWGGGKIREMSAPEFNGIQDQAALNESLKRLATFDKNTEIVTLYAMKGCPFCARVRSVLEYHGIPHEEIICDPFTGKQLIENAVKTVPQLQFRKKDPATGKGIRGNRPLEPPKALLPDKTKQPEGKSDSKTPAEGDKKPITKDDIPLLQDGPMIVDSDVIIHKLSVPLGFAEELETKNTEEMREKITNHFQRYVYISTHATWSRATQAMESETEGIYKVFPFNWLSGGIMYLVATKKVLKRAMAATSLTFAPNATPAQKSDKMLREWLKEYIEDKKEAEAEAAAANKKTPLPITLIDIEMQGVLSQVKDVPHIKAIVEETGAVPWLERVDQAVASAEGKSRVTARAQ